MARERVWRAHIYGDEVTVRHYAVLAPGEDFQDSPPTERMTLAEWQLRHNEFDCTADGLPLTQKPGVGLPDPMETARRSLAVLSAQDRATVCAETPAPGPRTARGTG